MFEVNSKSFIEALSTSVESGRISDMHSTICLFSECCFKNEVAQNFPDDVIEAIFQQMKNEKFQSVPDASILLLIFETEWGRLSDSQKESLLGVISDTFQSFRDDQSFFVLAEVLGEYFADKRALEVLNNIQQTENDIARAFLTYGYGKLADHASEEKVRNSAIERLNVLKNDKSESVKEEANIALRRINHQ